MTPPDIIILTLNTEMCVNAVSVDINYIYFKFTFDSAVSVDINYIYFKFTFDSFFTFLHLVSPFFNYFCSSASIFCVRKSGCFLNRSEETILCVFLLK